MRQRNGRPSDAIVSHENPARQALVETRMCVGNRGVRRLHEKRLHELEQRLLHRLAFRRGLSKGV